MTSKKEGYMKARKGSGVLVCNCPFCITSNMLTVCPLNLTKTSNNVYYFCYSRYYISKGAIVDQLGGDLNSTPLHWATRWG